MNIRKAFFLLIFVGILSSCGGGGSDSKDNTVKTGTVDARIADAPVDGAQSVMIHFTEVTLHGPGGNTVVSITDPITGTPGRTIDLLKFQSGQWSGFFNQTVTAGNYSWIRLDLDLSKSYIQINGAQYALACTSCTNNGFKLNRSFVVPADGTLTLMLDFDLRKSITLPNTGSLIYKLRPTVRIVEANISGNVTGSVDPTLISSLGGFTGCSVYAYTGLNAQLDDVYIPFTGSMPAGQNNPVATAPVVSGNNYNYNVAYLPGGDYTLAVTCDAENDQADSDDALNFSAPINTQVTAGQTTTVDFPAPAPPPAP